MKLNKNKIILYILIVLIIIMSIMFTLTLHKYFSLKKDSSSNDTTISESNNNIITVDSNSSIKIINEYDKNVFKGHKSLIFFWASWCSHCKEEYETVKYVIENYQNQGFKIYVISHDNDVSELYEFMKSSDFNYEVWFDEKRIIRSNLNSEANSVPLTYILNEDGKPIHMHESIITLEEVNQLIDTYLK